MGHADVTGHLAAPPAGTAAAAEPAGRPGPAEPAGLGDGTGATAERLLIGVSVYREPADHNAVLFQVGRHDWTAASAPGRLEPAPPYQEPADLADAVAAYVATGLLTVSFGGPDDPAAGRRLNQITVFVERPAAVELHLGLVAAGREHDLAAAHQRAAGYWQWRAACSPPGGGGDLHDLLEARHHLLEAGETEQACALTEAVGAQLHARGDLGREAALVTDMLSWLPDHDAGRAALTHELGQIAQVRADHAEAERRYLQALDMFAAAGDHSGLSRSHHSLGVLAQAQGDYAAAELRYRLAADTAPADVPLSAAAVAPPLPAPPPPALPPVPALEPPPGAALELRRTTPEAADPALPHAPAGPPWRNVRRRVAALAAAVGALLALGAYELPDVLGPAAPVRVQTAANATAVRQQAAAWVAAQVSRSAIVACDPAMCSELARHGVPAGNLLVLNAAATDPLGSDVVVATSSVRSQFGGRLASVYAPVVLASFGSRGARIEIRVIAPDGAAAYRAALAADLAARRQAGAQLLGNPQISATPAARQQLTAGTVDSRLLIMLATLAAQGQVRIVSFGLPAPGASGAVPLRSAVIAGPAAPSGSAAGNRVVASRAGGAAYLASVLAFLHAQRPPYLAAVITVIRIPGGQPAVRIGYPSPSPPGLLSSPTG
jgi:tetratricopeptide (TPR) repeat protein